MLESARCTAVFRNIYFSSCTHGKLCLKMQVVHQYILRLRSVDETTGTESEQAKRLFRLVDCNKTGETGRCKPCCRVLGERFSAGVLKASNHHTKCILGWGVSGYAITWRRPQPLSGTKAAYIQKQRATATKCSRLLTGRGYWRYAASNAFEIKILQLLFTRVQGLCSIWKIVYPFQWRAFPRCDGGSRPCGSALERTVLKV